MNFFYKPSLNIEDLVGTNLLKVPVRIENVMAIPVESLIFGTYAEPVAVKYKSGEHLPNEDDEDDYYNEDEED